MRCDDMKINRSGTNSDSLQTGKAARIVNADEVAAAEQAVRYLFQRFAASSSLSFASTQ